MNSTDTKIVVFLQNAWSEFYAGHIWPRPSWLRALTRSVTGKRLMKMIDNLDLCEETTPEVAPTASGKLPPDEAHIRAVLARRQPMLVVACGKQAEEALSRIWTGPLLVVPHPAARNLTNALYLEARALIESGFAERAALRQGRGKVERVQL